ncbi:hypothetical protein Ahy_A02g008925 [Arachis hypogaea]|uniref:Uncharacterized protein n=1 Tax=Arachis hypogaea TaxID=3818 RepID=A0A445EFH5_ARAHY|nr:hypothetical protein Ahy_A02g008925 [Arachis hypogaea]
MYGTVTQHLQELRNLFSSKDVTEGYNNEELVQMLVVDGCALLYFMCNINDRNPKPLMLKFDQLCGQLMLPGTVINDLTPYLYHNLIAYEMCPAFNHDFEFFSYFSLMDSLIDDAEDVKDLRAAGVLQNLLGSDEDVAKLFNELGHVLSHKHLNDYR